MPHVRFTIGRLMLAVAAAAVLCGGIAALAKLDPLVVLVMGVLAFPVVGLPVVFGINALGNRSRPK